MTIDQVRREELGQDFYSWKIKGEYKWLSIESPELPPSFRIEEVNKARTDEQQIYVDCETMWLIGRFDISEGELQPYNPLGKNKLTVDKPAYRVFSDLQRSQEVHEGHYLDDTRKRFKDFADKYGLLFGRESRKVDSTAQSIDGSRETEYSIYWGETFDQWKKQIRDMQEVLRLWDLLHSDHNEPDFEALEKVVYWDGDFALYNPSGETGVFHGLPEKYHDYRKGQGGVYSDLLLLLGDRYVIPLTDFPAVLLDPSMRHQALVNLANRYIKKRINEKLKGRVDLCLEIDETHEESTRLSTSTVPRDLLTAMWLQLYQEVAGTRKTRKCLVCGRWFNATNDQRQLYCRNRASGCRKRAYRIRNRVLKGELPTDVAEKEGIPLNNVNAIVANTRRSS
jgi:hypothetical protein